MRTDEEILKVFDEGFPKFKWFLEKYFPISMIGIEDARKKEKVYKLLDLLNHIWYYLPDNKFNLKENPPGWREFLNVIEE